MELELVVNNQNKEVTMMSCIEIAELTGKRHDTVKRSMRRMQSREIIRLTPLADVNEKGQGVTRLLVTKRDSYVVVAQMSPEFTARLVDRWQELEQKSLMTALPNFNNPSEAARAWADEVDSKLLAQE